MDWRCRTVFPIQIKGGTARCSLQSTTQDPDFRIGVTSSTCSHLPTPSSAPSKHGSSSLLPLWWARHRMYLISVSDRGFPVEAEHLFTLYWPFVPPDSHQLPGRLWGFSVPRPSCLVRKEIHLLPEARTPSHTLPTRLTFRDSQGPQQALPQAASRTEQTTTF